MSKRRPVVITDAERSQAEQLRTRQIRYASMMGIRIVCLIVAGVLVSVKAPMLWLWVPLCVVGMVLLPWMAVLIANDRPARKVERVNRLRPDSRARQLEAREHPIIDGTYRDGS